MSQSHRKLFKSENATNSEKHAWTKIDQPLVKESGGTRPPDSVCGRAAAIRRLGRAILKPLSGKEVVKRHLSRDSISERSRRESRLHSRLWCNGVASCVAAEQTKNQARRRIWVLFQQINKTNEPERKKERKGRDSFGSYVVNRAHGARHPLLVQETNKVQWLKGIPSVHQRKKERKKPPNPEVSFLGGSQMKSLEEEDTPYQTTTIFPTSSSSEHSIWKPPKKEIPPVGGGFLRSNRPRG